MEIEEALLIGSFSPRPAKKKGKEEIQSRETPSRPSRQIIGYILNLDLLATINYYFTLHQSETY